MNLSTIHMKTQCELKNSNPIDSLVKDNVPRDTLLNCVSEVGI